MFFFVCQVKKIDRMHTIYSFNMAGSRKDSLYFKYPRIHEHNLEKTRLVVILPNPTCGAQLVTTR